MAISRIHIENYRSIQSCDLNPKQMCALVGANGAGKSNMLRAINTVVGRGWVNVGSFCREDFYAHDPSRNIVIELEFDPPIKYQVFKGTDGVDIPILRYTVTHYKVDSKRGKKGELRLESGCFTKQNTPVMVLSEAPKTGKQRAYHPLVSIPDEVREQIPVIFVGTDRNIEDHMPSTRNSLLRRLLEDVDEALHKRTIEEKQGDGTVKTRTVHAVFMEQLQLALKTLRIQEFEQLETLLRTHSLENLGYDPMKDADKLSFHFELFESMECFKAMRPAFNEAGTQIDACDMGAGAQNALVIAIFQAYEKLKKSGAVFLIEEPEMFLHPHQRRYFYTTLRGLSARNQVIYSTHSAHFVAIPEYEEVRLVYRDQANTTKIRGSALQATPQLREKLRKEFDPERNELFFARHVILVEGDTEKLAIPEYAKRLGIDLNREDCSVIEVGGKKSLPSFIDVIRSFNIPLTVVFDTDSSDFGKDEKREEEKFNLTLHAYAAPLVTVIEVSPSTKLNYARTLVRCFIYKCAKSIPAPVRRCAHA
jgi:putative ATP-dependent endonuclease of OLD family